MAAQEGDTLINAKLKCADEANSRTDLALGQLALPCTSPVQSAETEPAGMFPDELLAMDAQTNGTRVEKLAEIRKRISEGTYRVSDEHLARKLLDTLNL